VSKKIVYKDIAPDAKQNFIPTAEDKTSYSNLTLLNQEGVAFKNFGNPCEAYSVLLDGSTETLPSDPSSEDFALVSNQLSQQDGTFQTPLVLTMTAAQQYSSQGITFTFDQYKNIFPNSLHIEWYRNTTLLSELDFYPDSSVFFCRNKVDNYNKVIVTFSRLNMPKNRLTLRIFDHGVIRVFLDKEITTTSIIQEINPIGLCGRSGSVHSAISINTTDFTLAALDDVDYVFQAKQPLYTYFNDTLKSLTLVDSSEITGDNRFNVKSSDFIGILGKVPFAGGIYSGQNAKAVLDSIAQKAGISIVIDSYFDSKTITGYIPFCTCREAIAYICFAIGACCDTAGIESIRIFKLSDSVSSTVELERVKLGQRIKQLDKVTEVQLVSHGYTQSSESIDLYSEAQNGTGSNILVKFSEPCHTLSITNGTILSSGANFAYINANSGCILSGKRYTHATSIKSIKNPLVLAGDLQNIIMIESETLVNKTNADEIAQLCYDYYIKDKRVTSNFTINNESVGDLTTQKTKSAGDLDVRIESMRYSINSGKIIAEVQSV
jgi:hypothetical protein